MNFRREGGACLSSAVRKESHYWLTFSTDENIGTLEGSAINDGRSMLAMFLTVLYEAKFIFKFKLQAKFSFLFLLLLFFKIKMKIDE